jgi:excisionase family DNA binding protein
MSSTRVAPRSLLTRAELAKLLRVSTRTVDRLARRGVIEPVRFAPGGRVVFRSDDIERLLGRR